jgi:hypothetical protein
VRVTTAALEPADAADLAEQIARTVNQRRRSRSV